MTTQTNTSLELGDIQAAALMPRPHPYAGAYLALRLNDRHAGRELLRRLIPLLDPVSSFDPGRPVSLGVGLSFAGLQAIGVPAESLATFPAEFQQGMAARADQIGDVGQNAPEHWEAPLGSKDVHLVVAALARDTSHGKPCGPFVEAGSAASVLPVSVPCSQRWKIGRTGH